MIKRKMKNDRKKRRLSWELDGLGYEVEFMRFNWWLDWDYG